MKYPRLFVWLCVFAFVQSFSADIIVEIIWYLA